GGGEGGGGWGGGGRWGGREGGGGGGGAGPGEGDGARRRHVERVHLGCHGNAHVEVCQGEGFRAEASPLGAEEKRDAAGPGMRADGHGIRPRGEREERVARFA